MRLPPLLLAALVFGAQTAQAASHAVDPCMKPADRAAFEVEGLKSELMVTALSCKTQDKYNAFVGRYHGDIALQEKDIDAYFKRVYGRQYQKAHDDYITNLANVQSQEGLKAGTLFCDNLSTRLDEVMSLHDGTELNDYVHGQNIVQPVAFTTCTTPVKAVRGKSRRRVATKKS